MYVGEVKVKQSELAGLIEAAECLRIRGLAIQDENPSANESLKSQNKVYTTSSSKNDNHLSNSVNLTDVSSHYCQSPSRKRQKKYSGEKETKISLVKINDLTSKVQISNSVSSQQSSSFSEKNNPNKYNHEPSNPSVGQRKVETDVQNQGGPSNLDNREQDYQNKSELGPEDYESDDSSTNEVDFQKEEIDISTNSEGAGPSQLQKVSFCLSFVLLTL